MASEMWSDAQNAPDRMAEAFERFRVAVLEAAVPAFLRVVNAFAGLMQASDLQRIIAGELAPFGFRDADS